MFQALFSLVSLLACLAVAGVAASPAQAQSQGLMLGECAHAAQGYFRNYEAETDMKYNGRRVDGTHAINGNIYLETRMESFACSYAPDGNRMIRFFVEGREQNAYLPGHTRESAPLLWRRGRDACYWRFLGRFAERPQRAKHELPDHRQVG